MKKKLDTVDLISLGLPIFTVITVILRALALLFSFDIKVGYFSRDSIIPYLDRSFILVAALFGIVVSLLTKKDRLPSCKSHATLWSTFASIAIGFVFAIFALLFGVLNAKALSPIICAIIALCILSALHFVFEGTRAANCKTASTLSGLCPIASLLLLIFVENFDFKVALNSSEKILATFLFAFASLYIVQRLKFALGSPSPRFHLWTAYLVTLVGFYVSIPGIIASSFNVLGNLKYFVYYFLALGIAIYACVDLIGRLRLDKVQKSIPTEPDSTI